MKKHKLSVERLSVQSFVTNAEAFSTKGGATRTCEPIGFSDTSCLYECPQVYTYCCAESQEVC